MNIHLFHGSFCLLRASDKRKNMAAQKAEAQRRLLRPSKKFDADDANKRRNDARKKKDELVRAGPFSLRTH